MDSRATAKCRGEEFRTHLQRSPPVGCIQRLGIATDRGGYPCRQVRLPLLHARHILMCIQSAFGRADEPSIPQSTAAAPLQSVCPFHLQHGLPNIGSAHRLRRDLPGLLILYYQPPAPSGVRGDARRGVQNPWKSRQGLRPKGTF